jgi:hypothetical protein
MSPHDFIWAAGKLAAIAQGNESLLRSAVSRAYYGSFHLVLEFLTTAGVVLPRNATAHVRSCRLLAGCGQPIALEIAGLVADLHADRIRADYRLDSDRFRDFARIRVRVERADRVARLISECDREPVRSEIVSGLRSCVERGV